MDQLIDHVRALVASGLTMREVARRAGCAFATVQRIHAGSVDNVTVATYQALMGVVANART